MNNHGNNKNNFNIEIYIQFSDINLNLSSFFTLTEKIAFK